MPRRELIEDDWDAGDEGDEEQDDTVPCPYCRRPIHEQAERCPHCENYISEEDAPPGPRPAWVVAGALACLAAVVLWVLTR